MRTDDLKPLFASVVDVSKQELQQDDSGSVRSRLAQTALTAMQHFQVFLWLNYREYQQSLHEFMCCLVASRQFLSHCPAVR